MRLLKVAPVFLLVLLVGAEKKIELQDIEEDNLKSEQEKQEEKNEARLQSTGPSSVPSITPLDFLKSGFLRYLQSPQAPQQSRYVQQYAVTEPPESSPVQVAPKVRYEAPAAQQAMVGYYSNVPMQIYLVPQYYTEPAEQGAHPHPAVQYASAGAPRLAGYPTAPDTVQPQSNYVEVPAYVTPTGKAYVQQYSSPVAYVTYTTQPTATPAQATVSPVVYQMPVVQYPTAIVAPPVIHKGYYQQQQYTETNSVDEDVQEEDVNPKYQVSQSDTPHIKSSVPEYPRYYNSRAPIREEYRHGPTSELPPPSPLLLKAPPAHLSHLPKALPMYRPLTKPVYAAGGSLISNAYTQRPSEAYGVPFKRRPTSLLDSYVPSSVQLEYLKRGYSKDPSVLYESLASNRHLSHAPTGPRHYERGFLPNQMYHTAAGGITYGHYKRTPKGEKVPQK